MNRMAKRYSTLKATIRRTIFCSARGPLASRAASMGRAVIAITTERSISFAVTPIAYENKAPPSRSHSARAGMCVRLFVALNAGFSGLLKLVEGCPVHHQESRDSRTKTTKASFRALRAPKDRSWI
jgi:hypothetical protein